jgi:hypothetical protein
MMVQERGLQLLSSSNPRQNRRSRSGGRGSSTPSWRSWSTWEMSIETSFNFGTGALFTIAF